MASEDAMGNASPSTLSRPAADDVAYSVRYNYVSRRAACASFDDGVFDPMPRLEWIDLEWPRGPWSIAHKIQRAQAMAIAWFELSCCSSFNEDENPGFWHAALARVHHELPLHGDGESR